MQKGKKSTIGYLSNNDMFSFPTASDHQLRKKRKEIEDKYNIKHL